MSTPSGSPSRPRCSSSIRIFSATASARPRTDPRSVEMPARERSSPSHGLYSLWCRAAEPKSHMIGSSPCGSRQKRTYLSTAHMPMCVAVMYRMLLMSKQSSAPSSDFSSPALARDSRAVRSRSKSTRSSQSTPITP